MFRHRGVIIATLALIVGMAVGCVPPRPVPDVPTLGANCPAPTDETGRIVFRGDSHGALTRSLVEPEMNEAYTDPVCYVAVAGKDIDWHARAFPLLDPDDCVLMEAGSNDLLQEPWLNARVDLWAAADALAGQRAQVWYTLNQTSADLYGPPFDVRVRRFNEELLRMNEDKERWPNLVVWRWDLESEGHPEWLNLPDAIHTNALGTRQMATSLVRSASACPGSSDG